MKKLVYISLLIGGMSIVAQQPANPFADEEIETELAKTDHQHGTNSDFIAGDNPGNPGAPIDDYIPLLLLAAGAIIIIKTYKRSPVS